MSVPSPALVLNLSLYRCFDRLSRTERSGRYGPDQSRDEPDWHERRERDQERDHSMRRWGDERRSDRHEGDRRGPRDSPEVMISIFNNVYYVILSW